MDQEAGRGRKQCPGCSAYVGVRTRSCPTCNHQFMQGEAATPVASEPQYYDGPGRGRKQCPKCTKYVGGRLTACYCGHAFAEGDAQADVIKTYDEAGRGRKQCPKCTKFVGARNEVCACGHTFEKGVATKVEQFADRVLLHPLARAYAGSQRCIVTLTPAGACPVKLTGIDADSIDQWIEQLIDVGVRDHRLYSISAICYFLREFVDVHSDEYRQLCAMLKGTAIEAVPRSKEEQEDGEVVEGLVLSEA